MRGCYARRFLPVAMLVTTAWIGPVEAAYRLDDLGKIASPDSFRIAGVNREGGVVGTMTLASGVSVAFQWSSGGVVAPANLPDYARSSSGAGINARGDITGSFEDTRDGNVSHAFRIVNGQFHDLGKLPGGSAGGTAISDGGEVAGNVTLAGGSQRAFRTSGGGGLTVIDPLAGGGWSSATGINNLGTVIGDSDVGYQITRAFVAPSTGPAVDLLSLHPGSSFTGSTHASAINGQGAIVGYGSYGAGSHAFLAPTSGPLIDLGVTGMARSSYAYGLNDRMQVVGALDLGGNVLRAFTWDAASGMVDLNSLLSASERDHWVLSKAMAIGESGQIAGLGYRDGELHAFLFSPVATTPFAIPEPPAWAMTAIGGTIAAGIARLRRGRTSARASA